MVMGMKKLDNEMVKNFEKFQEERKKEGGGSRIPQDYFESGLNFLGVTGVEDVLQWKVTETIKRFKDSSIRVWICTGDKYETTVGVAKACNLLDNEATQVSVMSDDHHQIREVLQDTVETLEDRGDEADLLDIFAINGSSLALIMGDAQLEGLLLTVLAYAKSAIFVRMAPS